MEVTKAKNGSEDYLIDWCNYVISTLVHERTDLVKAYNYYNGVRDHYQYENLEKNYGVGNPTSVGFTPLTRRHIEALVGEYLNTKPQPKISCKDSHTLSNMFREKQLQVTKETNDYISKFLNNAIYQALNPPQQGQQPTSDAEIERELNQIKESVDRNFISNYEIAAQDIIEYVMQNRDIDFQNKLEQLLLDLLIAGQAYYKVVPTLSHENFRIEVCDPLNTWIDKDPKSRYMKNGYKSVVRKWMSPEEIEIKYGKYLSAEDRKCIKDLKGFLDNTDENYALITGQSSRCGRQIHTPGLWADTGIHPFNDSETEYDDLIPVYDVEWIDSKRKDKEFIGYCYHVTRIGNGIYIFDEDDIMMPRNIDAPNVPRLSINGIWYTNGHGAPYSLMLVTANLQDNYDMTIYKKDNAIALSGTKGAIVDMSALPEQLGGSTEERIIRYQGYRKVGLALIDSAQEGTSNTPNTIYNGYDDTLDVNTIQAYQLSLQMIEATVSAITGVTPERLGGVVPRDAVANVETGMQQSFIITKRYYQAMDTLVKEMLLDCIDMAKVVYKKGITGQLVLGNTKKIFTLLPEYYTFTSYDIDLADSAQVIKEQELIKNIGMQYLGSNMMDPEIMLIINTSKSLTEMKELAMKSIREKKIENNQIQQLQQQLQQAQQQQQQMQKQLEESTRKIAQLNEKKLNIEQQNNQAEQSIKWAKVKGDLENRERELQLIQERNKLEAAQLFDNIPQNDKISNVKI